MGEHQGRAMPRPLNIAQVLQEKQLRGGKALSEHWAEERSTQDYCSQYVNTPHATKSTISIDFSPDGETFASTHGDHTVKISSFQSGRILQTLVGHRRTPWTVKYNPSNADIVASGDLAYEIRIWSISSGTCMYSAFLEFAIISLSFHPLGQCLAIASGTQIFFWDFHRQTAPIAAWTHHHTIRCVSFAPSDSHCLFVGAANGRRSEFTGDITFSLLSWEFDLENLSMKYPQVLLRRAILYNDGGFGISRCGRFICALAEFWRPAGMRAADPPDGVSAPSMQQHRKRQKRDELMSPSEDEWRASSGDSDGVMGRHNYWLYEEYWEMLYDGPDVPFQAEGDGATGEYITHIVKISLSLRYPGPVWAPGEALVVAARSLESYTSNEVTSVKFSPSSNFVIVGCGVMEVPRPIPSHIFLHHPVTSIYRSSDMDLISVVKTEADEDVNIALFHPYPGFGMVYGTKQGKICLSRISAERAGVASTLLCEEALTRTASTSSRNIETAFLAMGQS